MGVGGLGLFLWEVRVLEEGVFFGKELRKWLCIM
jgi:hypothetical protein